MMVQILQLEDGSIVELGEKSIEEIRRFYRRTWDGSIVELSEGSIIKLGEGSIIKLGEGSIVELEDGSIVELGEGSIIKLGRIHYKIR